jgi:hypothetical protein
MDDIAVPGTNINKSWFEMILTPILLSNTELVRSFGAGVVGIVDGKTGSTTTLERLRCKTPLRAAEMRNDIAPVVIGVIWICPLKTPSPAIASP